MGGVGAIFGSFAVDVQKGIVAVRIFLVVARAVVVPLIWILLAGSGASSFQVPSTGFTDGEVLVAGWIGTVDHAVRSSATDMTGGDHCRINRIYLHRDAVVKDVAFALEVFSACFHAVLDDASVKLIHIFKPLFQKVG